MNGYRQITAIALGMGILLSPDTWVVLGNFMGQTGKTGLFLLALNAAFFVGLALNSGLGQKQPPRIFVFIPFTIKGAASIFLSTGILVSSGFVFNEVFLHWFPNFGFAFLVLALVLGIHLFGPTPAARAQVLFAGLTLVCLFVLILSGLGSWETDSPAPVSVLNSISLPLILWVGFDLALTAPGQEKNSALAIAVILGVGLVYILWGLVSITHIPLEKLAASSLPQMKTAGTLLGQTGRPIMGAAMILGTLSAINALFLACRYTAGRLGDQGLLPPWTGNQFFIPLVLASAIGTMMAAGMAGSDRLEIWIRAAFLLWLLTYARWKSSPASLFLTAGLIPGISALLYFGNQPGLTVWYMALILIVGFIPGLVLKLKVLKRKILKNKRSLL